MSNRANDPFGCPDHGNLKIGPNPKQTRDILNFTIFLSHLSKWGVGESGMFDHLIQSTMDG